MRGRTWNVTGHVGAEIAASAARREDGKTVDVATTVVVANSRGGGAVPGFSAGTVITSGDCGITERAAARKEVGQADEQIEQ